MPVNLDQYRGAVGAFNSRLQRKNIYINIVIRMLDVLPIASALMSILLSYLILTKRSGDIEQNPRPKSNSSQSFSICH